MKRDTILKLRTQKRMDTQNEILEEEGIAGALDDVCSHCQEKFDTDWDYDAERGKADSIDGMEYRHALVAWAKELESASSEEAKAVALVMEKLKAQGLTDITAEGTVISFTAPSTGKRMTAQVTICRDAQAPNEPTECEKVGEIEIDTASLLLVDPCHQSEVDWDKPGQVFGKDYPNGRKRPIAILTETGIGDGRYPVFAINDPDWGKRVTALHIYFHPMYCFADSPTSGEMIHPFEADIVAGLEEAQVGGISRVDMKGLKALMGSKVDTCDIPGCDCSGPIQIHRVDPEDHR